MGRGDKRTRKGKQFRGSYGKTRSHNPAKKKPQPNVPQPAPAPKAGRGR